MLGEKTRGELVPPEMADATKKLQLAFNRNASNDSAASCAVRSLAKKEAVGAGQLYAMLLASNLQSSEQA
jgi:hypothetical protein